MQTFEEVSQSLSGASRVLSGMATSAEYASKALEEFGALAWQAFSAKAWQRKYAHHPAIISRKSRRKTWRKYHG